MSHGSYVVIDLETTGLDPQLEGILELAGVQLEDGQVVGRFERLVDPGIEISPASQAIHGIDAAMLAGAPPVAAVLDEWLAFLGARPIVAHNAPFDLAFLNRALALAGRPPLENVVYDSLEIAREVLPDQRSYKLEALCRLLDHPAEGFHRAAEDAGHLAAIWPRLIALYRQKLAWYRGHYERIDHAALRYEQLNRLIESLQAELADQKRLLGHYFADHPGAAIALPNGERLVSLEKTSWDYDGQTLAPFLAEWGLAEKLYKLDRPRLERFLAGDRLDEAQKALIQAHRFPVGTTTRLAKETPPRPDGPAREPA